MVMKNYPGEHRNRPPGKGENAPHPLGGRDEGFETTYFYKDKPPISPLNASVNKARSLNIIIDKSARAPLAELSPWCLSRIKERLTFENPEFIEANRMGRSTWNIPREIRAYEIEGGLIILPRGFTRQFIRILQRAGCTYKIEDQRRALPEADFKFTGTLKDFQTEAVNAMLSRDFGTLSSPTGSGKTVMALAIIEARKQPTLIIVHSKELVNQWVERIGTFLGIPCNEIGIIGNGKKTIGPRITIGIINSIHKVSLEIREHFGHVVVDECHRVPARTFTEGLKNFDARYMLGLSATPWRRDKLSRLIYWNVGDVVHKIDQDALMDSGDILRAEVIIRETDFRTSFDPSEQYSLMLSELTENHKRNALIVQDVTQEAEECSGVCLVLTDRKAHVEALVVMLQEKGLNAKGLHGDFSNRERQAVVENLNSGAVKALVATGQLIGEGFDCKELSSLFLACPIRFDGRLLQYLGRVLRPAPGKDKARVFDYIDHNIGVLENSARARQRAYLRAS